MNLLLVFVAMFLLCSSACSRIFGLGDEPIVLVEAGQDAGFFGDAGAAGSPGTEQVAGKDAGKTDASLVPTLTGLSISPGALSPPFDPAVRSYQVEYTLSATSVYVTASAPEGVRIMANEQELVSGASSPAIPLNLGLNPITISVSTGEETAFYQIHAKRRIVSEAYLKRELDTDDHAFGSSVALDGNTLAIGALGAPFGDLPPEQRPGVVYVFTRAADGWQEQVRLVSPTVDGRFGWAMALDGDTLALGVPQDSNSAQGNNATPADGDAPLSGAVYIFVRDGEEWTQKAYLKASNAQAGAQFGYSVALSGDGLVVGASREAYSGAAYVFERMDGKWSEIAYLKASNANEEDYFGYSVAIEGNLAAVGAPYEASKASGINGDPLDNGVFGSGAVYIFERQGQSFEERAYLKASNAEPRGQTIWGRDEFGTSLAFAGPWLAVGAPGEDSNGLGPDNNEVFDSGAVYVFHHDEAGWSQDAYLKAPEPHDGDSFGSALSMSGELLVVGAPWEDSGFANDMSDTSAPGSGAAYAFTRGPQAWGFQAYLKASNIDPEDRFGISVAVSENAIVAGAMYEASNATGIDGDQLDNSEHGRGAGYVFAF